MHAPCSGLRKNNYEMNMGAQLIKFAKPFVERFPAAAMTYRYIRDSRRLLEEPRVTPMSFKLLGNRVMEEGLFEPVETEIVKKLLQQADVFINVGANIGYYCCLALNYGKHVLAFEPIELNLKYLKKNIKANHWEDRIEIFPLALSNKIGISEIYGGATGASLIKGWAGVRQKHGALVKVSTMDDLLGSRFQKERCFILVDIEGAEGYMLEGAGIFLNRQPKPIWMIEITVSEHQPEGIRINPRLFSTFDIFWKKGYQAWTADKQCRSIHADEIEEIVKNGKDTLLTHNFLFIEKGRKEGLI
jgi:FkbM family methyltransferase